MKYLIANNQTEILPNILGLKSGEEIALSEFEGFLKAEILLSENLSKRTKINARYILKIHKMALGHLYSFAGTCRKAVFRLHLRNSCTVLCNLLKPTC